MMATNNNGHMMGNDGHNNDGYNNDGPNNVAVSVYPVAVIVMTCGRHCLWPSWLSLVVAIIVT